MDFLKNSYKKFINFASLFDNVTAVIFALDLNLNGAATIIKETYKVVTPYGLLLTITGMAFALITIWQDFMYLYGTITASCFIAKYFMQTAVTEFPNFVDLKPPSDKICTNCKEKPVQDQVIYGDKVCICVCEDCSVLSNECFRCNKKIRKDIKSRILKMLYFELHLIEIPLLWTALRFTNVIYAKYFLPLQAHVILTFNSDQQEVREFRYLIGLSLVIVLLYSCIINFQFWENQVVPGISYIMYPPFYIATFSVISYFIHFYTISISNINFLFNWITGIIFIIVSCRKVIEYALILFWTIRNFFSCDKSNDSLETLVQEIRMSLHDFVFDYNYDQNKLGDHLNEFGENINEVFQQQNDELKNHMKQQKKLQQNQELDNKLEKLKEDLLKIQIQEGKKQKQEINQQFTKSKEDFEKQLKSVQSTIGNLTKQQGLLFNLVLDLKNVNANSNQEQKQSDTNESNKECRICLDKASCFALVPCGHIVACEDCEKKLPKDCPICRNEFTGTLKVYLP